MLTREAVKALMKGQALPGIVDCDYFGNTRTSTPDIGAHQLSGETPPVQLVKVTLLASVMKTNGNTNELTVVVMEDYSND